MMSLQEQASDEQSCVERRRGLRVRQARPIKVYEPASARYVGGRTVDISSTGLQVELPASSPVRPGRLVSIHVGAGEGGEGLANRRRMIPAKVVWTVRGDGRSNSRLLVGVEFLASIAAQMDAA